MNCAIVVARLDQAAERLEVAVYDDPEDIDPALAGLDRLQDELGEE